MNFSPAVMCASGVLAAFAGVALLLASAGRKKKPAAASTALGLAVGFGGVAGLAAWFGAEAWLALPMAGLAVAWLAFAAFRSGALVGLAWAVSHPIGQACLLLAGGVALAGAGMWKIENDLRTELDESEAIMAMIASPIEFCRETYRPARTDAGRPVSLMTPTSETVDCMASFPEEKFLRQQKLEKFLIQTGPVDAAYNCHGWVFAAGRFWVKGEQVPTILADNDYQETKEPAPGDAAVFYDGKGQVAHTALVRGLGEKGTVLLESKWGKLARYIHTARQHMYGGTAIRYYRTSRGSHVLAGLPGDSGPEQPDIAAAE